METSKWLCMLILCFFILRCQKDNKNKQSFDNKQKTLENQKVWLFGKAKDTSALYSTLIINNSYLFGTNHKYMDYEKDKNSIKIVLDSISESMLMEVMAFGANEQFYRTEIYLSPGDSLYFEMKDGKILFDEESAPFNNYLSEVYSDTSLDYGRNPYAGDIWEYKKHIKNLYESRMGLFEVYVQEHKIESANYIKIMENHLRFEYLYNLVSPRLKPGWMEGIYYNDLDGLKNIVETEYMNREGVFDYSKYLDNITLEDFKQVSLLGDQFFKNSLNGMLRYYFEPSNNMPYTTEKFLAEKKFIQQNLDGDMENYIAARMIWDYSQNGYGYSKNDIALMKDLIDEYLPKFKDETLVDKIEGIKSDLNQFNFELSENTLNSKLLSKLGDTLTLEKLFSRSNKRIKVLDFWASWCGLCIDDIQKSKAFKDRLTVEYNIEWIYISVDRDQEKWTKSAKELNDFFGTNDQYFLLAGQKSSLISDLKIRGIPRYVILDKQNQIVLSNAPNPSNSEIFERIINEIE